MSGINKTGGRDPPKSTSNIYLFSKHTNSLYSISKAAVLIQINFYSTKNGSGKAQRA